MRNCLIVGAGSTVKHYIKSIKRFIADNNCVTIGINNITKQIVPDYHLWTNTKRFMAFHHCIKPESKVVIGSTLHDRLNVKKYVREYDIFPDDIKKYRNAGCLAIKFADSFADTIYIAGMDGYTLCYKGDQHCYGKGCTDSADHKYEQSKDGEIYHCLQEIDIDFTIITPTVYERFYDKAILATDTA